MSCSSCGKPTIKVQGGNQNMAILGIGGLLALLGVIILSKK